jgi:hypothetical protein
MGLEIEYTGEDGRKYDSLEEMLAADVEKILTDQVAAIERAVTSTRCSVHDQKATVSVSRTGEGLSFKIDGCCEELCARAERAASAV